MTPLVAENVTASPGTGLLWASLTVAVAVLVELPSAGIELCWSWTETWVAGPGVSVRVVLPETLAVVSVAVTVDCPAVVELVSVVV